MSATSPISAGFSGPEFIQRGIEQVISCPLFRDGEDVPVESGTVGIFRPDGIRAASAAVSVVDGLATYTTPTLAGEKLGERWRVEWVLTLVEGGPAKTFDRQAILCRRRLFPVISDRDLLARHTDLAAMRPPDISSFQGYIDVAWSDLLDQIRLKGSLPHLVCSPEDLRQVHTFMTLEGVFRDFMVRQGERWASLTVDYGRKATASFNALSLLYSPDDDGKPATTRRPVAPVTFLASGGDYLA